MSAFTPGPWVAKDADGVHNTATVGYCGAWVFGPDHGDPYQVSYDDHGTEEGDARLCAMAPELLAEVEKSADRRRGRTDKQVALDAMLTSDAIEFPQDWQQSSNRAEYEDPPRPWSSLRPLYWMTIVSSTLVVSGLAWVVKAFS